MIKMKKAIFFIAVCFFCAACEDQDVLLESTPSPQTVLNSKISVDNGRLVFNNAEELYSIVDSLSKMSEQELKQWSESASITSLINNDDEALQKEFDDFGFPNAFKAIINENGEYQVGNTISWYHEGFKYFADSESELEGVKQSPNSANERIEVEAKTVAIEPNDQDVSNQKVTLYNNSSDARHQKEFFHGGDSGSKRKYVHEIRTYTESYYAKDPLLGSGYSIYSSLTLVIKLEWWGNKSKKWKVAGGSRRVAYDLSGSALFKYKDINYDNVTRDIQISKRNTDTKSGDRYITIASYGDGFARSSSVKWEVDLYGKIEHSVEGDLYTNKWINSGNPLW